MKLFGASAIRRSGPIRPVTGPQIERDSPLRVQNPMFQDVPRTVAFVYPSNQHLESPRTARFRPDRLLRKLVPDARLGFVLSALRGLPLPPSIPQQTLRQYWIVLARAGVDSRRLDTYAFGQSEFRRETHLAFRMIEADGALIVEQSATAPGIPTITLPAPSPVSLGGWLTFSMADAPARLPAHGSLPAFTV